MTKIASFCSEHSLVLTTKTFLHVLANARCNREYIFINNVVRLHNKKE